MIPNLRPKEPVVILQVKVFYRLRILFIPDLGQWLGNIIRRVCVRTEAISRLVTLTGQCSYNSCRQGSAFGCLNEFQRRLLGFTNFLNLLLRSSTANLFRRSSLSRFEYHRASGKRVFGSWFVVELGDLQGVDLPLSPIVYNSKIVLTKLLTFQSSILDAWVIKGA